MAKVLTSVSGAVISAASAGYAPTNSNDVSAIVEASLPSAMSSYVNYSAVGTNSADQIVSIGGSSIAGGGGTATGDYVAITSREVTIGNLNTAEGSTDGNIPSSKVGAFAQGFNNSSYCALVQGGYNTASSESLVVGSNNSAKEKSIVVGFMNTASANESIVVGSTNSATGSCNIAVGSDNRAYDAGISVGLYNTAVHTGIALGRSASASMNSIAVGGTAETDSLSIGTINRAYASSVAIGQQCTASRESFAHGKGLYAQGGELSFGTFNSSGNGYVKLSLGDGTANNARHNLLTVYKSGEINITTSTSDTAGINIVSTLTGKADSSSLSSYVNYSSIGTDSASAITSIGGSSIAGGGGGGVVTATAGVSGYVSAINGTGVAGILSSIRHIGSSEGLLGEEFMSVEDGNEWNNYTGTTSSDFGGLGSSVGKVSVTGSTVENVKIEILDSAYNVLESGILANDSETLELTSNTDIQYISAYNTAGSWAYISVSAYNVVPEHDTLVEMAQKWYVDNELNGRLPDSASAYFVQNSAITYNGNNDVTGINGHSIAAGGEDVTASATLSGTYYDRGWKTAHYGAYKTSTISNTTSGPVLKLSYETPTPGYPGIYGSTGTYVLGFTNDTYGRYTGTAVSAAYNSEPYAQNLCVHYTSESNYGGYRTGSATISLDALIPLMEHANDFVQWADNSVYQSIYVSNGSAFLQNTALHTVNSYDSMNIMGSGTTYDNTLVYNNGSNDPTFVYHGPATISGSCGEYDTAWPMLVISSTSDVSNVSVKPGYLNSSTNTIYPDYEWNDVYLSSIDSSITGSGYYEIPLAKVLAAFSLGTYTEGDGWAASAISGGEQTLTLRDVYTDQYNTAFSFKSNAPSTVMAAGMKAGLGYFGFN